MLICWLRVIVGVHTWGECARFVVRRWRGGAEDSLYEQGFLDIFMYIPGLVVDRERIGGKKERFWNNGCG